MCLLLVQARRGVLGGIIGAAALLSSPRDASAAFGDAARVSLWVKKERCRISFYHPAKRAETGNSG